MASFNFAMRMRTAPDPDRQIEVIQETFARRSMPFVWWVTDQDAEDGLGTKLRAHGFDYGGEESSGMALALTRLPQQSFDAGSLLVARVVKERDIRTWFATLLESFGVTPDGQTAKRATKVYSYLVSDRLSGWHLYLAYLRDRQVGSCALHLGRAAGLYAVGTLPMARRQGVGTALTERALADAVSAGHGIATLTASELGARLYTALGFKEYCGFREYVWRPSSDAGFSWPG